ncbi:hypothetical protein KBF38_13540 [bacterium]|nr:hypothetical protein [bacterium]
MASSLFITSDKLPPTMTYRFDKSGKRIPAGTAKDKLVAAAENRDSQSNGLQNSATAQRTTGTSHLVQTQKSALANQKIGRKGPDADLSKPLRHIGLAVGTVITIVLMMVIFSVVSSLFKGGATSNDKPAAAPTHTLKKEWKVTSGHKSAAAPLPNLGHWSKAEVLKNLFAASQKAHDAKNYSSENAILKNLSQSQPAETKAMLTKLVATNPKNLKYQWQLAIVLYHCASYDQAKVVNDKIIQQLKGSHQSLEIQGLAYSLEGKMKARLGRDQDALQDLTTAVSLFEKAKLPDLTFVDTLRDIAWLELRTGRRMQAAVLFERVNTCTGESAGAEPASPESFMMENIR